MILLQQPGMGVAYGEPTMVKPRETRVRSTIGEVKDRLPYVQRTTFSVFITRDPSRELDNRDCPRFSHSHKYMVPTVTTYFWEYNGNHTFMRVREPGTRGHPNSRSTDVTNEELLLDNDRKSGRDGVMG